AREGGGAGGVDREALGAVDRAAQRDRAGAGERRIGPERDGIIIGLRAGGADTAASEGGGAARVGRETRERVGGADGAGKRGGAGAIRCEGLCQNDSQIFESNSVSYDTTGPWLRDGGLHPVVERTFEEFRQLRNEREICLIVDFYTMWEEDSPIVEGIRD